jgi:anti-sigma factor RsiW
MNCEEANHLLDAYLDGELDLGQRLELEPHLSLCPSCQNLLQESEEFQSFFAATAPRFKAPPQLRAKVLAKMQSEQAKQNLAFLRQPWVYAAAVLVLGLCALTIFIPDNAKEVSGQAVARYTRSLAADHLVDIASSDQKVLKAWFAAKLKFTPPLADLQAPEYSLMGGRVDVIQNRPVAALVYERDKRIATLFCWPPNNGLLSMSNHFIEGYNVYTWGNAKCNYIVVSKLDKHQTDAFVDSLRARGESGSY